MIGGTIINIMVIDGDLYLQVAGNDGRQWRRIERNDPSVIPRVGQSLWWQNHQAYLGDNDLAIGKCTPTGGPKGYLNIIDNTYQVPMSVYCPQCLHKLITWAGFAEAPGHHECQQCQQKYDHKNQVVFLEKTPCGYLTVTEGTYL